MDNLSLTEAIQQLKSWNEQKEYDKVIIGCKEILAAFPTNQEVLSLMKEADEKKSTLLKGEILKNNPNPLSSTFPEQITVSNPPPTPGIKIEPVPLEKENPPPEPINNPPPLTDLSEPQKITSLDEAINKIETREKKETDQSINNPLITPSEQPMEEKENQGKEKTRKTIIIDLSIKFTVAILLSLGVYFTWTKYLKNELYPPEITPPVIQETTEDKKDETSGAGTSSLSPKNLFEAMVKTAEEEIKQNPEISQESPATAESENNTSKPTNETPPVENKKESAPVDPKTSSVTDSNKEQPTENAAPEKKEQTPPPTTTTTSSQTSPKKVKRPTN